METINSEKSNPFEINKYQHSLITDNDDLLKLDKVHSGAVSKNNLMDTESFKGKNLTLKTNGVKCDDKKDSASKKSKKRNKNEILEASDPKLRIKKPRLFKKLLKIQRRPNPIETSNILQRIFISYISPLIDVTNKLIPDVNTNYPIPTKDTVRYNQPIMQKYFIEKKKGMIYSFIAAYKWDNFLSISSGVLVGILYIAVVYITKLLIDDVTDQLKHHKDGEGYISDKKSVLIYAGLLVICNCIIEISENQAWVIRVRLVNKFRNGIYGLFFDKLTRIGITNPNEHDQGSIINYLQNDIEKLWNSCWTLNIAIENILKIILGISMGFFYFGLTFSILIAGIIVVGIFNTLIFKKWFHYEDLWATATDKRLQFVKNMLKNVKFIKMNALENTFFKKIHEYRSVETGLIFTCTCLASILNLLFPLGNSASIVAFLYVYFQKGGVLDVATITVMLRVFSLLNEAMIGFPVAITGLGDLKVGTDRLTRFLRSKNMDYEKLKNEIKNDSPYAVEIQNGWFYWDKKINKEQMKENEKEQKLLDKKVAKEEKKKKKNLKKNKNSSSNSDLRQTLLTTATSTTSKSNMISPESMGVNITNAKDEEKSEQYKTFKFDDLNFTARKGDLTMIIGSIGSGKTSLLQAIFGEMRITDTKRTKIFKNTSIAYCGQTPWLMNGTVKENIILNYEYDKTRFENAVKYSALQIDISNWTLGENHIIGDEGSAVSGGQRTRIALARCLYQDPQTYIFDDVMSALDAKVGSFIMEETILKKLKGKSVIMVTHGLQYLKYSDKVYVMDNGEILLDGSFKEVKSSDLYQKFLELDDWSKKAQNSHSNEDQSTIEELDKETIINEVNPKETASNTSLNDKNNSFSDESNEDLIMKLNTPEEKERGRVSWNSFKVFIEAMGGWFVVLITLILALSSQGLMVYGYNFLEDWSHNFSSGSSKYEKLKFYAYICLSFSILTALLSILTGAIGYFLSIRMHSKMTFALLHCEMEKFLDRIPIGRVINKFSSDIDTIDKRTYADFAYFLRNAGFALSMLVAVCFVVGIEMLGLISIWVIIAFRIQQRSMTTRRELKRVHSIQKSPMINCYTDILKGLTILRNTDSEENKKSGNTLFKWQRDRFYKCAEVLANLDISECMAGQWFELRVCLYQILFLQVGAFLLLVFYYQNLSVSKFGLFTLILFSLGPTLREAISGRIQFEISMVAIERASRLQQVQNEPNYKYIEFEKKNFALGGKKRIHMLEKYQKANKNNDRIISKGEIIFENVSARYLSSDRNILKNLDFKIQAGEKIGVVGRTGSGKSSLIKLFWGYLNPSEGRILIDNIDISNVDLKSLRRQMSIISQETALFEGTLKFNLDPTGYIYTDKQMNDALKKLNFSHESYQKDGLEMEINLGGGNLSKGEQQLICFARCILNRSKLIILDEATASIDIKTEESIQKSVETDFNNSTMIIIAHRVQTVMNCDRIIVLKDGEVVDIGTPHNLIKKDGFFKDIVEHMQVQ